MSGFSKKASKGTGSTSNVDWDAFNDHLLEQIGDEVENRVAIVSGLIDLGTQERPDFVADYKGTKQQKVDLESGRSFLSDDEEEIITPQKPVDQVAIMADFPEVMINYGKFFSADGDDDWKPYRHLITNEYWDDSTKKKIAKGAALSCRPDDKAPSGWAYDGKSTIAKLAIATGESKSPVDQNFDIGSLLGGVFTMDLVAEESKDGKYINIKAKNPSKKHPSIKVPEYDIEPFGIMMTGENDEDSLKQIRASIKNALELAVEWETSGLKKELENFDKSRKDASKEDTDQEDIDDDQDEEDEDAIFEKAEELGMRVTRRTTLEKALAFIKDAESDPEQDEEEEEKAPVKKRSPVKKTTAKSASKTKPEEDEDDELPPF